MTPNELFTRLEILIEKMSAKQLDDIANDLPEGTEYSAHDSVELILDLIIWQMNKGVDVRKWLSDALRAREAAIN